MEVGRDPPFRVGSAAHKAVLGQSTSQSPISVMLDQEKMKRTGKGGFEMGPKNGLVGEMCGSLICSNGGRKLGSRSPRTRCGIARLQLFAFVASCLSNQFALGKRYGVRGSDPGDREFGDP